MVVRMKSAVSKCCCCGECKGVVGCCACACKTLCFSIEGAYRTYGSEADWDGEAFETVLDSDAGEVNVSVTFEQDEYGCYVIGNEGGYEKVRYEVGYEILCNNLTGVIPTSVGDVSFVCTTKAKPRCTTCECLCECVCVTLTDYSGYGDGEYVYTGKLCWDEYTQMYSGTVAEITQSADPLTREVQIWIRPNEYTDECEMLVYVDGEESSVIPLILENCNGRDFNHIVDFSDGSGGTKYTAQIRCAECHEECDPVPNLCFCPGRIVSSITATMFSGLVAGPLGVITLSPSFICMDLCQSSIKIAGECQAFEGQLSTSFPVGMGEFIEDTIEVRLFCRVGFERYFQYRFSSAVEEGNPGWTDTGVPTETAHLFRCSPTFYDIRSAAAGVFGLEGDGPECLIDPFASTDGKTVYQIQEFVLEEV
jgi:hypothetical protein